MTDQSKKSTSSQKRKSTSKKSASKKASSKAKAPAKAPVEEKVEEPVAEEAPAKTEVETTSEDTPAPVSDEPRAEQPGRTAKEWLSVARLQLGVKPWILRAAVSGHDPERKYTETEMRKIIRRKLSEPV